MASPVIASELTCETIKQDDRFNATIALARDFANKGQRGAKDVYDQFSSFTSRSVDGVYAQAFITEMVNYGAGKVTNETPADGKPMIATLIALANLPIWRSCDTDADVALIATTIKHWVNNANNDRLDLEAEGFAAIRRAEGQVSDIAKREPMHPEDPKEIEAQVAALQEITNASVFVDTDYGFLAKSLLAAKNMEGFFWHVSFDDSFADIWRRVGSVDACETGNRPCELLAAGSRLLDEFVDVSGADKDDLTRKYYYFHNDHLVRRALAYLLAGKIADAKMLLTNQIIAVERNRQAIWYDQAGSLDHVYVYKFFRDKDTLGPCAKVEGYVDPAYNRCPAKSFYNPTQIASFMIAKITELEDSARAAQVTVHDLDNELRQFQNHDYRLVLSHLGGEKAQTVDISQEFGGNAKSKISEIELICGDRGQPVKWANICRYEEDQDYGRPIGYYFTGGNLSLDQAIDLKAAVSHFAPYLRPYLLRPLIKG